MKKLYYVCLLAFVCISCEDVLDKKNLSAIGDDYVWEDPNMIELNVNSFYLNYMPTGLFSNPNELGVITDEARSGYDGRAKNIVNGVRFGADRTDVPYQEWRYPGVRKINEFLQNVEERYILPANALQAQKERRDRFIGEAKFFRALLYFDMIKVYGGVPIITKVIDRNEKDEAALYPKRNTTEECFDFVIRELKEAADLLPKTYSGDNWGRITKGAALAFKAKIELWQSSPLFNLKNERKYWEAAYTTYHDIIDLNVYDLHPQFSEIWKEKGAGNKEIILFKDYKKGQLTHGWDAANMMRSQAVGDATANCPVQQLVDAFPMLDGTSYVVKKPETVPYENRDPRLRATVVWNGDTYGSNKAKVYSFVSESKDPENPMYNLDAIDSHQSATSTGYYMRKMTDESLDGSKGDYGYGKGSFTQWVEIRYAEVLLGLAESANEMGETEEAVAQLKVIRHRAGILPGEDNRYGIPVEIGQTACRELIQNEYYIEFAFENKRYWDLRRWKLAHIKLSKKLTAMEIKKKIAGNGIVTYTYNRRDVRHDKTNQPVFLEKFYLLPLPVGERQKNPNLEQNEEWK